jgi:hypothetical protein
MKKNCVSEMVCAIRVDSRLERARAAADLEKYPPGKRKIFIPYFPSNYA